VGQSDKTTGMISNLFNPSNLPMYLTII